MSGLIANVETKLLVEGICNLYTPFYQQELKNILFVRGIDTSFEPMYKYSGLRFLYDSKGNIDGVIETKKELIGFIIRRK